eukprot:SAG11_NODE_44_length_20765_cov_5.183635_9_plen_739_part_00
MKHEQKLQHERLTLYKKQLAVQQRRERQMRYRKYADANAEAEAAQRFAESRQQVSGWSEDVPLLDSAPTKHLALGRAQRSNDTSTLLSPSSSAKEPLTKTEPSPNVPPVPDEVAASLRAEEAKSAGAHRSRELGWLISDVLLNPVKQQILSDVQSRAAKVVATLGAASQSAEALQKIILAGANVVRLDCARVSAGVVVEMCSLIRGVAAGLSTAVEILVDLPFNFTRLAAEERGVVKTVLSVEPPVECVSLAFVRREGDLQHLFDVMAELQLGDAMRPRVCGKVGTREALEHADEIIGAADCLVVQRTALGSAMGWAQVPYAQKVLVKHSRDKGKDGFWVAIEGGLMENASPDAAPSIAETSDAANSVFDGADAVILTGAGSSAEQTAARVAAAANGMLQAEAWKKNLSWKVAGRVKNALLPAITDHSRRRTLVIATLGAASQSAEALQKIILAGANVVRLDCARVSAGVVVEMCSLIRGVAAGLSTAVEILVDLPFNFTRLAAEERGVVKTVLSVEPPVECVSLAFVRREGDLQHLFDVMAELQLGDAMRPRVCGKVGTREALEHADEIIGAADCLVVQRTALGSAMGWAQVPYAQKVLVKHSRDKGKDGFWVAIEGGLMENASPDAAPSIAETSDAANSVFDGADAVILTGAGSSAEQTAARVAAAANGMLQAEAWRSAVRSYPVKKLDSIGAHVSVQRHRCPALRRISVALPLLNTAFHGLKCRCEQRVKQRACP